MAPCNQRIDRACKSTFFPNPVTPRSALLLVPLNLCDDGDCVQSCWKTETSVAGNLSEIGLQNKPIMQISCTQKPLNWDIEETHKHSHLGGGLPPAVSQGFELYAPKEMNYCFLASSHLTEFNNVYTQWTLQTFIHGQ